MRSCVLAVIVALLPVPAAAETIRLDCTGSQSMTMSQSPGRPGSRTDEYRTVVTIDTTARIVTLEGTRPDGSPYVVTPTVAAITPSVVSYCEARLNEFNRLSRCRGGAEPAFALRIRQMRFVRKRSAIPPFRRRIAVESRQ